MRRIGRLWGGVATILILGFAGAILVRCGLAGSVKILAGFISPASGLTFAVAALIEDPP